MLLCISDYLTFDSYVNNFILNLCYFYELYLDNWMSLGCVEETGTMIVCTVTKQDDGDS